MTIQFGKFRVASIQSIGAFLDRLDGQQSETRSTQSENRSTTSDPRGERSEFREKQLFLPLNEQTHPIELDETVVVAIYEDRQGRPCSSMRLDKFTSDDVSDLKVEQKVDLIIYGKSDLGYKALINKKQTGVVYFNEVFRELHYAEEMPGYIAKIRDDKKIDLLLQPFGNKGADDIAVRIIEMLEDNDGYLAITDKTDADVIYKMFGVSKKKFKMALGGVYKKKLITIEENGIRLKK
jgi:predicted RNA-binding protein (virulence factor B family)